jgi:nitrogen-specific signal transduction histidine kinase
MDEIFAKVERAKKEWEATIDALSEGVALFQTNTLEIRRANWRLARFLHSTPHQLVGANIHTLLCDCSDPGCSLLTLLSASEPTGEEIWREDSHQKWMISTAIIPDMFSQESNTVIVVRDVTQERAMQDCLIESEKKAVILRVASGLAEQITPSVRYCLHYLSMLSTHVTELRSAFCDYRIALTQKDSTQPASGFNWEAIESRYSVEFILQDIAQAVKLTQNDLRKIFSAVNHISNLEESRPHMLHMELNRLMEDSLGFVKDELGDKIILESSYAQDLPAVMCNPVRMQMALTGLLSLLAQSSPLDGRLKIKTRRNNGHVQVVMEASQEAGSTTGEAAVTTTQKRDIEAANLDMDLIANIIQDHGGELQFNNGSDNSMILTVCLPVSTHMTNE